MIQDKTKFWIRVAGWSGLISAMATLTLYQESHSWLFLVSLALIILFSAYVLATSNEPRWHQEKWLFRVLIFCLVFVSILPSIFIGVAYYRVRKQNRQQW